MLLHTGNGGAPHQTPSNPADFFGLGTVPFPSLCPCFPHPSWQYFQSQQQVTSRSQQQGRGCAFDCDKTSAPGTWCNGWAAAAAAAAAAVRTCRQWLSPIRALWGGSRWYRTPQVCSRCASGPSLLFLATTEQCLQPWSHLLPAWLAIVLIKDELIVWINLPEFYARPNSVDQARACVCGELWHHASNPTGVCTL